MLDHKISLHPEVVDTRLNDGEAVLLHLESKMYYSLNPTGERIWRGIKAGLSLSEISRSLQEEFDVSESDSDNSIVDFIEELSQQNLVLRDTRGRK